LAPLPRPVVVCADDFGLTEGVSRGILDLAQAGRLSATSVMANRPHWPQFGPELRALHGRIGVGLHLTLTLGEPLGQMTRFAPEDRFPGFGDVLKASLLRRLPRKEIRDEIDWQLASFESVFGRHPDFVDGHQHVHVLPGIRDELLAVLKGRGLAGRLWLRDPADGLAAAIRRRVSAPKALIVRALAFNFAKGARAAGFAVNEGFSGFSPFDASRDVAADLERAFDGLGPRPVVMCHPGHVDEELRGLDPVVETREREMAYLASDRFARFLEERALRLVPSPAPQ
jgi:predicted glycoside hydrolase/deacetylase ChbG (UPF0249 family)